MTQRERKLDKRPKEISDQPSSRLGRQSPGGVAHTTAAVAAVNVRDATTSAQTTQQHHTDTAFAWSATPVNPC